MKKTESVFDEKDLFVPYIFVRFPRYDRKKTKKVKNNNKNKLKISKNNNKNKIILPIGIGNNLKLNNN